MHVCAVDLAAFIACTYYGGVAIIILLLCVLYGTVLPRSVHVTTGRDKTFLRYTAGSSGKKICYATLAEVKNKIRVVVPI